MIQRWSQSPDLLASLRSKDCGYIVMGSLPGRTVFETEPLADWKNQRKSQTFATGQTSSPSLVLLGFIGLFLLVSLFMLVLYPKCSL